MSKGLHDKFAIAAALRETGLLLKARGENAFKARAYITAAKSVEQSQTDIGILVKKSQLTELEGVGESLASYISTLYQGGDNLLDKLRVDLPPKTIKKIANDSQIKSVEQILLVDALATADQLIEYMTSHGVTIYLAGEARRWHEAVSKITFVTELKEPKANKKILKAFKAFALVTGVSENKSNKELEKESKKNDDDYLRVKLSLGIEAELYLASNLTLKLFELTGSREHYQALQKQAIKEGMKLSETALKKGRKEIAVQTETEIYSALNLPYIIPELREDAEQIKQAVKGKFADLIEISDIQGMTHCHSTYSDGRDSIEAMARAAQSMGMKYITLTDHSPTAHYAGGLPLDKLKAQWEEIDRVQDLLKIRILKGTECDILADGKLDYPDNILDKFDIIIASIHSRYKQNEEQMTRRLLRGLKNKHFKVWGHPLGRLVLRRDPIPCDVEKILDAVAESRLAIEINGDPYRLDLEPRWAKLARDRGLKFIISTDAHSTSDLQNLRYGIHMARRAGLSKSDILNTLPLTQFKKVVKAK